jgi:hypothetical protein
MATKTESTVQVSWPVTAEHRAPALEVEVPKCTYVLPWNRFLYAEGDASEVRAFFSTHDLIIQGCGLDRLLSDLAAQRVAVLKQPIRADRFEAASAGAAVQIASIEVHVVQEEA